jgi:hypothetical protein
MLQRELIDDFITLFEGNRTALGRVWGESVKAGPEFADFELHLAGEEGTQEDSLGIYTSATRDTLTQPELGKVEDLERSWNNDNSLGEVWCRWGCTDLDNGYEEGRRDAITLIQALDILGVTAWPEKTKGKGWHVWIFAEEWVPSEVMRRVLLAAHQMADLPVVEVNPKQTDLGTRVTLGNYVNLPYFYAAEPGKRVVIALDENYLTDEEDLGPIPLETFVAEAIANRADFETLLAAARLYVEPPPKEKIHRSTEQTADVRALTRRLNGLTYTVFRHGPKEGMDRSSTLAKLAHLIHEDGKLSAEEALVILIDADERWGKFYDRPDQEDQLWSLVENAYG